MATKTHKTYLAILTKMGVEFTDEISTERAAAKITRNVEKKGIPDDLSAEEKGALVELGFDEPKSKKEETVAKEDKDEEEDEKPVKKKHKEEAAEEEPKKKSAKKEDEDEKPAKKEKKEKKEPKPPYKDNLLVMKELIKMGATDKEIRKHFVKLYAEKGKEDLDWVDTRIMIYKKMIVGKKAKPAKEEDEKPAKKEKKEKKAEKDEDDE